MTFNNNDAQLAQQAVCSFLDLQQFVDWLYNYYNFNEVMWAVENAHTLTPDFDSLKQEMCTRAAAITPAPYADQTAAGALQQLLLRPLPSGRHLLREVETMVREGQWQKSLQAMDQLKGPVCKILAYIAVVSESEDSSDSS